MLFAGISKRPCIQPGCYVHGGDSNGATCAVSPESFVYDHMQTLLSSEYIVDGSNNNTYDFAVVRDMKRPSIYSDDSEF